MQVIKDYDYDKDGKLNMAEYSQYKSDISDKSSDNDEVVFKEVGNKEKTTQDIADKKKNSIKSKGKYSSKFCQRLSF